MSAARPRLDICTRRPSSVARRSAATNPQLVSLRHAGGRYSERNAWAAFMPWRRLAIGLPGVPAAVAKRTLVALANQARCCSLRRGLAPCAGCAISRWSPCASVMLHIPPKASSRGFSLRQHRKTVAISFLGEKKAGWDVRSRAAPPGISLEASLEIGPVEAEHLGFFQGVGAQAHRAILADDLAVGGFVEILEFE